MTKANYKEIQSLDQLKEIMTASGAVRLFVKKLAPNDNSKNQVYLGGNFEVLNILPYDSIYVDDGAKGSKRDRFKANIFLGWLSPNGYVYPAPNAQLILYPKYPEVRMSGFLSGCEFAPSEMMRSRQEGRLMFLGITGDGKIIGHVTSPDNPIHNELEDQKNLEPAGVLLKLPLAKLKKKDTRDQLLGALREIHAKGWIDSVKLHKDGSAHPYNAQNGGGYTLEAQLGISPNGYSEPDFLGWEIKQHGVKDFAKPHSGSPVTLMTPEPTAGIYKDKGVEFFIRQFGYADKSGKEDRFNFGGRYRYRQPISTTELVLDLTGYDKDKSKITDPDGGLTLLTKAGEEAATWRYTDMMKHWNRKHAQAAYIPSLKQKAATWQYRYGNLVDLGSGTDFLKFLKAVAAGIVFYDPGIKLEKASTAKPVTKRRSQFRIASKDLGCLYEEMKVEDILQRE